MAKGAPNQNLPDDFNLNTFVENVSFHSIEIPKLTSRIEKIEEKFGDNEKLADTLHNASQKAVKMQKLFDESFIKLLDESYLVKEKISKIINNVDRNHFYTSLKRFGFVVYTILIGAIGSAVTVLITHLAK